MSQQSTFALFFGNRGFFPASLQKVARQEMHGVLTRLGHDVLMLDEGATQHGAVETPEEGRIYADFLHRNRGKYHGVILCLPKFGEGRFTEDPIPSDFFGCAGVVEIPDLQACLQTIGYTGFRHHVSVTPGTVAGPVGEALSRYLGHEVLKV